MQRRNNFRVFPQQSPLKVIEKQSNKSQTIDYGSIRLDKGVDYDGRSNSLQGQQNKVNNQQIRNSNPMSDYTSQTIDVNQMGQKQSNFKTINLKKSPYVVAQEKLLSIQKQQLASVKAMFGVTNPIQKYFMDRENEKTQFRGENINNSNFEPSDIKSKTPIPYSQSQQHSEHIQFQHFPQADKSIDPDRVSGRKKLVYENEGQINNKSDKREPIVQNNFTINIQNLESVLTVAKSQQRPKNRDMYQNLSQNNYYQNQSTITRPQNRSLAPSMKKIDDVGGPRSMSVCQDEQNQIQKRSINQIDRTFQPILKIICSYRTRQGYLASNPEKTNQDSYQICQNFKGKGQHLFFVCDGHGTNGHLVSNFMKINYPKYLLAAFDTTHLYDNAMVEATRLLNQKLQESKINCNLSGSTFIQFMFETCTGKITCGNVGDSRAIIGSQRNGIWSALPLSQDHKPNLPLEMKRIKQYGGRVDSYRDQYGRPMGPMRVWLKTENVPGLAMSRSIGDFVAASVGVSAEPEIYEHTVNEFDKFIVMASDGVWEFMSNEMVVNTIAPFFQNSDINGACDALMKESRYQWTQDDCSVVDDITFIMIFIDKLRKD